MTPSTAKFHYTRAVLVGGITVTAVAQKLMRRDRRPPAASAAPKQSPEAGTTLYRPRAEHRQQRRAPTETPTRREP